MVTVGWRKGGGRDQKGPGVGGGRRGGGRWHVGAKASGTKRAKTSGRPPEASSLSSFPILSWPAAIVESSGGNSTNGYRGGGGGRMRSVRAQSGMMPLGKRSRDFPASPDLFQRPSSHLSRSRDAPLTPSSGLEPWSCCLCGLAPWRGELGELVWRHMSWQTSSF